jgi:hypothetical protein
VVKEVVVAPKVALLVYKANLKELPPELKLCVPFKSSNLKLVVRVDVIAIFISFL